MRQREALAYGQINRGGIVLGGENAGKSYELIQWDWSINRERTLVTADFWLHGADSTDFARKLLAMKALAHDSGNLGITTSVDRTITSTAAFAAGEITITRSSGDFFAATDVGLPIDIPDVGSFQVSAFDSTTVVRCRVPDELAAPVLPAGEFKATIGILHVQTDEALKTGFIGRAEVERVPNDEDEKLRRRFRFRVTLEHGARLYRDFPVAYQDLRDATYRVRIEPTGLRTVSFRGVFASDASDDAVTHYLAQFGAWAASITATLPGTYEQSGADSYEPDDENGLLRFTGERRQINFPDTAAAVNDPAIKNAKVRFTRSLEMVHGLQGVAKPYLVQVNYDADIDVSEKTYDEIADLWKDTVKPHLITQASTIFGSARVILNEQSPVVNASGNGLSASMTLLVSSSGSNVYQYRKTESFRVNERVEDDTIHDGVRNTFALWTPGHRVTGAVAIVVTLLGRPTAPKVRGGSSFGFGLGGGRAGFTGLGAGFFALPGRGGGRLSINFDFDPRDNGSDGAPIRFEEFPEPGDPNVALGDVGDGEWIPLGRSASRRPEIWGTDPENIGSSVEVTFLAYSQAFLWVKDAAANADPVRPPTRGVEEGGGDMNSVVDPPSDE